MNRNNSSEDFLVVGISYKNTDAATRGQYSISAPQYESVLKLAPSMGVHEMFVLSTCNRTEIYGFAPEAEPLLRLLHSQASGEFSQMLQMAYIKSGTEAVRHLYEVGCGLDSQILGDYEIVGQLRHAVEFARCRHFLGAFTERLTSSVFRASKSIKTHTRLSSGSVSVSFSAARYIREKAKLSSKSSVLVIGAGKIARNTCKNLLDAFRPGNITVINRTLSRALALSRELQLNAAAFEALPRQIEQADIVIVATSSAQPVVLHSHLKNCGKKLVIDLSMPSNVDPAVNHLANITLIHVDQISRLKDETLNTRKAEVPKAQQIIEGQVQEFMHWLERRQQLPALNSIINKLTELDQLVHRYPRRVSREISVQQVINKLAGKMLENGCAGCHYLEAMNQLIAVEAG